MQRRDFLKHTGAIGGAAACAATAASALTLGAATKAAAQSASPGGAKFKLKYGPHYGHFAHHAGQDYLDQLKFAADQGFTAWEDNGMKGQPPEMQGRIGRTLADLGMTMGVFVAHGDFRSRAFVGRDDQARERVVQDLRDSVPVAQRVGARWMTVVPDSYDPRLEWGYQTANCIDLLRRCAEVFEPHNLVMVLEPLNWWTDHPGLFLHKIPQAYEICRAVNSPACKILFDIYHQQIQEGNLIPNIDLAWDEIAYFQTGDNPGRKEPGTGEINYRNIFKHLHAKGYDGVIGMEHGKSLDGPEGEDALIAAYRTADDF
ncbi:MAG TPA: TIM barrel protein [Lacipirellulaceae bacterium]|nr:TIM barrel protein [Lacipirellulaceae bacterium]